VEYFEIMAKNTNKRIPVKWVRDRAKAAYEKKTECCVCGSATDLELHHLHSVTILLDKWSEAKGYDISTDAGILAVRDEFIDTHRVELYDQVYTLCNRHHVALHSVYGKAPRPGSEPKQAHWIETQRAKHTGGTVDMVVPKKSFGSFFSEFT
jgi:5-methylcytosine-specific restriction endonuclease McrA